MLHKLLPRNVQSSRRYAVLTCISLASYLWDIGKQYRPRAEHEVSSGATLFAFRNFIEKGNNNEKVLWVSLKISGLLQLIKMGKSTQIIWVKSRGCRVFCFLGQIFKILSQLICLHRCCHVRPSTRCGL